MRLVDECTLSRLTVGTDLSAFDCSNGDLNDFLQNDALSYDQALLGRTYIWTLDADPRQIVCFFTVSNDSLRLENLTSSTQNRIKKRIAHQKHRRNYPAVLIGRLGVNLAARQQRQSDDQSPSIGDQLMDFIKGWFNSDQNKTGCRFIIVDAYNKPQVLRYYERNGFKFLQTRGDENKYNNGTPLTRAMFFDLIQVG